MSTLPEQITSSQSSRPARGGWIEISEILTDKTAQHMSRPARGGWIEMIPFHAVTIRNTCPVPRGAGGLKYKCRCNGDPCRMSRPARGGWIEIFTPSIFRKPSSSRPARGGWIEINNLCSKHTSPIVPSREGRVD